MNAEDRAEAHLRRVIALTGARRLGPYCYALEVGDMQFEVHDSYGRAMPAATDPPSPSKGTCFFLPDRPMPVAEKIAIALLQLKNNLALFEKWAAQGGSFKADGELFSEAPTGYPNGALP
jgi:hypothetical protein